MKKINSLSKMFIKEFYQNIPFFDKQKRKFNKKSVFFWSVAILFISITFLSYKLISLLVNSGQPEIFLNLSFWILEIFLSMQAILTGINLFFFSKDIEKVLHMPLKPIELLLARFNTLLAMLYIAESMLGIIPITLYGLLTNSPIIFYIWEIVVLLIFPIFLAFTISIIMLVIMRFAKFIKNKDRFQLIVTVILLIGLSFIEYNILQGIFGIKNNEQALEQFTTFSKQAEQINKYFLVINPSINILSEPLGEKTIISLLKIISYSIISGIIFVMIGKVTYLKDILRNIVNNTKGKTKKIDIKKSTKSRHKGKSYIIKELKMLIREPAFFIQCIFPVIMILVSSIIIIAVAIPKIIPILQQEEIKQILSNLKFNSEVVCDILIVLQVLFSISSISLTAISREGKQVAFIKYIPIELYKQFIYKAIPQIMLNSIVSMVVLGIVWYLLPTINILYLIILFIISNLISFVNSYLMLIVDLRRPNLDWDTAYAVTKRNDNKLFQYVFMILNVLFLLYIAKVFKEVDVQIVLISEALIFATIFIVIDRCIKKWQKKLFNKI